MAITVAQLQDYINNRIKQNSNKEITGTVMKYALTEMLSIVNTKQDALVSGTTLKTINGTSLLGSGNLVISSSNIGNSDLTISAGGLRKLKMYGSSASDIFAIESSASATNLFEVRGNGVFNFGTKFMTDASNNFTLNGGINTSIETVVSGNSLRYRSGFSHLFTVLGVSALYMGSSGRVGLGTDQFGSSAQRVFSFLNGVAPTTSPADIFQMYSADIVAGNAAPHFRTENGDIQKIYSIGGWGTPSGTLTRTTFDASTVTLPELGERVAALITDLKTGHQLLKS